jgi:hypothetical protein
MKRLLSFLIIFILPFTFSCKQGAKEKAAVAPAFPVYRSNETQKPELAQKNEIFYGLLTPVEICTIFNRLGIPYNNTIINPASNKDLYVSNTKVAINTGVYGADFGYLRVFGVGQDIIDYMVVIREMSNRLGIPDEYITEPLKKVQDNVNDADTILYQMNNAYLRMEARLREDGRESTAGLMMMGGWVEALYIATQVVYDPAKPDPEVIQKIAQQKYTLNTLINFLANYYNDPAVVYYSKKLKSLKEYFDSFDIYFKKGDLEIDTIKKVFRSSGPEMNVTIETINMIRDFVSELRNQMITP